MFKKSKILLVFVLSFVLCLGSVATTLAASTDPAAQTSKAAITKVLKVPHGTTIPATMNFKFNVAQKFEDGKAPTAAMPVVGAATAPSTTGVVTINFSGTQVKGAPDGGTDLWYLESSDIFAGVAWPHAGTFEYEITEQNGSYTLNATPPPTESVTYSLAKYTLKVYVIDDGTGFKITHIGAIKTVNDDGTPIDDMYQTKVDPTPDGTNNYENFSQLRFTNIYSKNNGGTDPKLPTDWTLSVSKEVIGIDPANAGYFSFQLTLNTPALLGSGGPYKGYIVELKSTNPDTYEVVKSNANDIYVTGKPNNSTFGTLGYTEFPSGIAMDFKLKHNQFLVFMDTPVGTSYAVSELGTPGYKPFASVTYDGVKGSTETTEITGGLKLPLSTNTIYKETLYVGEGANSADFINDRGGVTPTGLNLNDLPFIALIALAFGSLIAFIVVKSRKGKTYGQF